MATGLQAALAVVSGLRVTESRGGEAFRVDVTMLDSALSLTGIGQGAAIATGDGPPTPDMLTGGLACYGIYRCGDGLEIACGALEPQFFGRVAELVGDPSLAQVQYDVTGQDALRGRLTTLFAVAAAPRVAGAARGRPDLRHAGAQHGRRARRPRPARRGASSSTSRSPTARSSRRRVRSRGSPSRPRTRSPRPALGRDGDALLAELGLDPAVVRATGALG